MTSATPLSFAAMLCQLHHQRTSPCLSCLAFVRTVFPGLFH